MLIRPKIYEFKINGETYECTVDTLRWNTNSNIPEYKLKASIYKKKGHIGSPVELKEQKRMTWKETLSRIIEILKTEI